MLPMAFGQTSTANVKAPVTTAKNNPFLDLMQAAWAHARAHAAKHKPSLSPLDSTVLDGSVPVAALHAEGFAVVPWTTDDQPHMGQLIALGVDGIITDRPDLLQQVVSEARAHASTTAKKQQMAHFVVSAHRGGRGLRPENTLPSFESGLDNGINQIETDTGVTTDRQSLIWHDQFLNPASCRHADGTPYTMENRVYIRDLSMPVAQETFICDKLKPTLFPDQRNDLSLSPAAVAFAKKEGMPSPYAPTNAAQLFRFVRFYAAYYKSGPGRGTPQAKERAHTAENVTFNLETKILPVLPASEGSAAIPPEMRVNHTVDPRTFVDTLSHAILSEHMAARSDIQSFDFRTLQLFEEQYPQIPTYYLTGPAATLSSALIPASLRQPAQ
jgi:glycerophosphoryl diester phosphodiesterase